MCNLYSMTTAREAVIAMFQVGDNRASAFDPLPAIFPGDTAPVVRRAGDGERELVLASWGFVLPQQGKAARRVTNARAGKVRSSPFWRESFKARRCVVPVTSFSEPKGKQPAVWHWFALKGDEPRPLFAFAGLWRAWKGPLKPGGETVSMDVYAILTTSPNELVATIYPARMPVMLGSLDECDTWLEGAPEEAWQLARPYPARDMHIVHRGDKRDAA
jgi:putative SOS response-associated peptidase YedK